jgi:hypothetical protein
VIDRSEIQLVERSEGRAVTLRKRDLLGLGQLGWWLMRTRHVPNPYEANASNPYLDQLIFAKSVTDASHVVISRL